MLKFLRTKEFRPARRWYFLSLSEIKLPRLIHRLAQGALIRLNGTADSLAQGLISLTKARNTEPYVAIYNCIFKLFGGKTFEPVIRVVAGAI